MSRACRDRELACFVTLVHKEASRITAPLVPPRLSVDSDTKQHVDMAWKRARQEAPVDANSEHVARQVVQHFARELASHCYKQAGQMRTPLKNELRAHNQLGQRVRTLPARAPTMCSAVMLVQPLIQHCVSVGGTESCNQLQQQMSLHMVTVSHADSPVAAVARCLRESWSAVMIVYYGSVVQGLEQRLRSLSQFVQTRLEWDVLVLGDQPGNTRRIYEVARPPTVYIVNGKSGQAYLRMQWKKIPLSIRVFHI